MRVLIYGAGAMGSLYAARLQDSGQSITILARGERAGQIRDHGIVLDNAATHARAITRVSVAEELGPDDAYDMALVFVRKTQLPEVLPALAGSKNIPTTLFMMNNAAGWYDVVSTMGWKRALAGFPGAGGKREGHIITYALCPSFLQPTTIGELDGRDSPRLQQVAGMLALAGFPVAISRHIDAWLKTHAAIVEPLSAALYAAGGDVHRLARTRDALLLAIRSVREGFRVLRATGIPVTPLRFQAYAYLPEPLLIAALQRAFDTEWAELVLGAHANAARDEVALLASELRYLARSVPFTTPNIDRLFAYIEPGRQTIPAGSALLSVSWRSTAAALGAAAGLYVLISRLSRGCCRHSQGRQGG